MSILPLTVTDAEVRRQRKRIIGPVSLTLSEGGITILMGPNGSGKTTLLKLLHGLDRPARGKVSWAVGTAAANLRQAYVFQTPVLLRRTAIENVAYPLQVRGRTKRDAIRAAEQALADVGLTQAAHDPASALSGGEKQKLALARAWVTRPEVLFLDEPTASLDGTSTREIEAILTKARDSGTKLVMATHDLGQARRLAGDVIFLLNGVIHDAGSAADFFAGPATDEARGFLKGEIVE